jgi:hypothetical protein
MSVSVRLFPFVLRQAAPFFSRYAKRILAAFCSFFFSKMNTTQASGATTTVFQVLSIFFFCQKFLVFKKRLWRPWQVQLQPVTT